MSSPDNAPLSAFAQMVKRIRVSRGYSQAAVTARAGLSAGYIGMIENGQRGRRPSHDTVLRLAVGLRATDDEREELLRAAGYQRSDETGAPLSYEEAVNLDPRLRADQKRVLVDLYTTMVRGGG